MAFGRQALAVVGISLGFCLLYNYCDQDKSSLERKVESNQERTSTTPHGQTSSSRTGYQFRTNILEDDLIKTQAREQLAQLASIQNILEDENSLAGEDNHGYVRAAFALYEYCQTAEGNEALHRDEELRDKFRELFYRVPTYADVLKYHITFPEEKEYFSFNQEGELDSKDVRVFCPSGSCPDLDIESVFKQVCGYAMDDLVRHSRYDGQQSVEDFVFAQLLISTNEQEFKTLLANRVIYDQQDIFQTLYGRVENYSDLNKKLGSLLPTVEEPVAEPEESESNPSSESLIPPEEEPSTETQEMETADETNATSPTESSYRSYPFPMPRF